MIRQLGTLVRLALVLACVFGIADPVHAKGGGGASSGSGSAAFRKLDRMLARRAKEGRNRDIRVIIELVDARDGTDLVKGVRGRAGRRLRSFNGHVAYVSEKMLEKLAEHPLVKSIHLDRPTRGELNRTAVTIGARYVQSQLGYDGSGVGVAVIDSGIASWHDDLTTNGVGQRVVHFVDFVNNYPLPYDDNGHGTHVAGIIAGNGYDSNGAHAGIAPGAHLIGLKVLDENGGGYISDVIAALDYVIAHKDAYNIRVANLSVGAAVMTSYQNDPLTLAAKRVVEAGIVVVTAAGNLGKNASGQTQYGAITAPGNAPWVLTVGASSHQGTTYRLDDQMGEYSSRGPTAYDFIAKPDVVAPGTGTVSLATPSSRFYLTKASYLVSGTRLLDHKPYLSLTGTSMASPVVAGTVALMLQANSSLTPNAVKAILQYTSHPLRGVNYLAQGAGAVNAKGAVSLAEHFANPANGEASSYAWSKHIIWGNRRVRGGALTPDASAWATNVVWGTRTTLAGQNVVWGTLNEGENFVWGTAADGENIVWGTLAGGENIVWGTDCGGTDCENVVWGTRSSSGPAGENVVWGTADELENIVWGTADLGENIVWGTAADGENIVWGTLAGGENIVWGTDCGGKDCENVVWGTRSSSGPDSKNVVWGTADELENIVWGTADLGENVVWGTAADGENVVWGTNGDRENVVWGTSGETENVVWGTSADEDMTWGSSSDDTPFYDDPDVPPVLIDPLDWDEFLPAPSAPEVPVLPESGDLLPNGGVL